MREEDIAKNIKRLRESKKMTLQGLADATGLTKSYLSKIERSKKAPPYSTINKIAIALGIDATFILSENLQSLKDTRISFTRAGERTKIDRVGPASENSLYGFNYEAIAVDKPGKNMVPLVLEPAFDEEVIFKHDGEELIYVLEGRHEFTYDGKKHLMKKGDSVYFDATVPHTGRSVGKKKAKLLVVLYSYRRVGTMF